MNNNGIDIDQSSNPADGALGHYIFPDEEVIPNSDITDIWLLRFPSIVRFPSSYVVVFIWNYADCCS